MCITISYTVLCGFTHASSALKSCRAWDDGDEACIIYFRKDSMCGMFLYLTQVHCVPVWFWAMWLTRILHWQPYAWHLFFNAGALCSCMTSGIVIYIDVITLIVVFPLFSWGYIFLSVVGIPHFEIIFFPPPFGLSITVQSIFFWCVGR